MPVPPILYACAPRGAFSKRTAHCCVSPSQKQKQTWFTSIWMHVADKDASRATNRSRLGYALIAAMFTCVLPSRIGAQTMEHQGSSAASPEVVVHAFGSVEWAASGAPEEPNSFALG